MPDWDMIEMRRRIEELEAALAAQGGVREAAIEECAKIADAISGAYYAVRNQCDVPEQRTALTDKHTVAAEVGAAIRKLKKVGD